MSMSRFFPDLGAPEVPTQEVGVEPDAVEDEKLKSFEAGYGAGWEDAVKAQNDTATQLAADLTQSISDIEFSFQEATGQFGSLIEPVLQQIVTKLLPAVAQQTLGQHVVQEIQALVGGLVADQVVIATSPDNAGPMTRLLEDHPDLRATITADASLSPGQAEIRIAETEREVDLDAVIAGIEEAVSTFFHSLKEGKSDG